MKKLLIALLTFTFISAQAGVVVEPYLGTHFNSELGDGADNGIDGMGYGLKLGYGSMGFVGGLNYKMANFEDENGFEGDFTSYGLYVGYNFPILFRVWGEYVFSGEFDDGVQAASGTRLGVGYNIVPMVSLNLEMGSLNFSETNSGADADVDMETFMLSVSIPLSI